MTNPLANVLCIALLMKKAFLRVFSQQPMNVIDLLLFLSLFQLFVNLLFNIIHFIVMNYIKIILPCEKISLGVSKNLLIYNAVFKPYPTAFGLYYLFNLSFSMLRLIYREDLCFRVLLQSSISAP